MARLNGTGITADRTVTWPDYDAYAFPSTAAVLPMTAGDLLYASSATAISKLAKAAAGSVLLSGNAPSWGQVPLTTHVTGTLPVGNGGTGLATLTAHALYVGNGAAAPAALAVGATGTVLIGNTGADPSFSATPTLTSATLSAALTAQTVTATRTALATTSTDGAILENTTAATSGVTVQISPRLRLRGTAWDTSASQTLDWILENLPATGATPRSTLRFGHALNGAAATYPMLLENNAGGALSVGKGSAPATNFIGDFVRNQDGPANLGISNSTAGTASFARVAITSDAQGLNLYALSSSWTTSGQFVQGHQIVAGTSYLDLSSNGNNPIDFWSNGSKVGSIGSFGVRVGDGSAAATVQFGGTTSSFPALKRSTTALEVKLADDSAYASLTALNLTATTALQVGSSATVGSGQSAFGVAIASGNPYAFMAVGSGDTTLPNVSKGAGATVYGGLFQTAMKMTGASASHYALGIFPTSLADGSARTVTQQVGIIVIAGQKDANTTVTTAYGIRIQAPTIGGTNYPIYIDGGKSYLGDSIAIANYFETVEMAAPSAPAANGVRIYAVDNGAGKTQLMAIFASGAAQQIAIQP